MNLKSKDIAMNFITAGEKSWITVDSELEIYHRKIKEPLREIEITHLRTLIIYDLDENKFVKNILLDCIPFKWLRERSEEEEEDYFDSSDISYIQYEHLLFYFKTIHTDFEKNIFEPNRKNHKKGSSHL